MHTMLAAACLQMHLACGRNSMTIALLVHLAWESGKQGPVRVQGISYEEALGNFWVLDADGLITIKRPTALNHTVKSFARKTQEDVEGESLVETVRRVRSSSSNASTFHIKNSKKT